MKVLILSITTGEGHNSTAKAIKDELVAKGMTCDILDAYGYINKALQYTVDHGYLFFSSHTRKIYSKAYGAIEKRQKSAKLSPMTLTNKALSSKLYKYISNYDPDVIIFTHVFAGMLVDMLKKKERIGAKTIGILTDFTFHPYWEETVSTDRVVIPNSLLAMQGIRKGYSKDQLVPIGIPIRKMFEDPGPQPEARRALGIDEDKRTLLIMGGSMGYGRLDRVVKKLDAIPSDFQMLVVCGNNKEAKKKIESLKLKKPTHVYGFVNEINRMMEASDCIVTKPGGLTTSEALAERLPMIIVNPIPGQEERNREFLINNGTAMAVSKTMPIDEVIFQLFSNPERIEAMKKSIEYLRRPNSTEDLCKLVMELGAERSGN